MGDGSQALFDIAPAIPWPEWCGAVRALRGTASGREDGAAGGAGLSGPLQGLPEVHHQHCCLISHPFALNVKETLASKVAAAKRFHRFTNI